MTPLHFQGNLRSAKLLGVEHDRQFNHQKPSLKLRVRPVKNRPSQKGKQISNHQVSRCELSVFREGRSNTLFAPSVILLDPSLPAKRLQHFQAFSRHMLLALASAFHAKEVHFFTAMFWVEGLVVASSVEKSRMGCDLETFLLSSCLVASNLTVDMIWLAETFASSSLVFQSYLLR